MARMEMDYNMNKLENKPIVLKGHWNKKLLDFCRIRAISELSLASVSKRGQM